MEEQENAYAKNDFSEMLENLFSDPMARERFEKIVGSLKENWQTGQPDPQPQEQKTHPVPAGNDGLTSILSNPALMENLPALLSGMRPQVLANNAEKTPEDRRRDLLLALKPFLSEDRGNAVDMILQISRLGAVLRMMR